MVIVIIVVNNKMVNLAEKYIEEMDNKITFDEFFDKYNVPKDARSDFAVTSILKQVKEILNKRDTFKMDKNTQIIMSDGSIKKIKNIVSKDNILIFYPMIELKIASKRIETKIDFKIGIAKVI